MNQLIFHNTSPTHETEIEVMRKSIGERFAFAALALLATQVFWQHSGVAAATETRPNILFCISDDQSYAHTGANGDPVVQTPAFDRIAREGLRFTHAFC
ncbi:MAG: sulfatase-like hydrolase/transferase, partial [Mariniblastus sp.]|nr:sulfatase-like hydrolase/transferase [Mariniblastus sp.]